MDRIFESSFNISLWFLVTDRCLLDEKLNGLLYESKFEFDFAGDNEFVSAEASKLSFLNNISWVFIIGDVLSLP